MSHPSACVPEHHLLALCVVPLCQRAPTSASRHEPSPAAPPRGPAVFHVTPELPWALGIPSGGGSRPVAVTAPGHLPARFPVSGCGTPSWLCAYLWLVLSAARHRGRVCTLQKCKSGGITLCL